MSRDYVTVRQSAALLPLDERERNVTYWCEEHPMTIHPNDWEFLETAGSSTSGSGRCGPPTFAGATAGSSAARHPRWRPGRQDRTPNHRRRLVKKKKKT